MSTCTSCDEGWSLNKESLCAPEHRDRCNTSEYYENGHCKQCHTSCKTCAGPGEDHCVSCQTSLLLQGKRCVYQCDDGYYSMAQPSRPVCVSCILAKRACLDWTALLVKMDCSSRVESAGPLVLRGKFALEKSNIFPVFFYLSFLVYSLSFYFVIY